MDYGASRYGAELLLPSVLTTAKVITAAADAVETVEVVEEGVVAGWGFRVSTAFNNPGDATTSAIFALDRTPLGAARVEIARYVTDKATYVAQYILGKVRKFRYILGRATQLSSGAGSAGTIRCSPGDLLHFEVVQALNGTAPAGAVKFFVWLRQFPDNEETEDGVVILGN